MTGTPPFIEITRHAADRFERVVVSGDRRSGDDAHREIRDLVRSGAPASTPPWMLPSAPPTDDARRYLAVNQDRALVLSLPKTTADGRDALVVLSVITRPVVGVDGS